MGNTGTKVPKTKCRGAETAKKAWAHPKGCAHFSWGGRGRWFKSSHSDQISTAIMIRNGIVKAALIFCSNALIYKVFLVLENDISVRIRIISIISTDFLRT